jgi:transposase-like protein
VTKARIRDLRLAGASLLELRTEFGLDRSTIHRILTQEDSVRSKPTAHLDADMERLYREGKSVYEIADILGVGRGTVGRLIKRVGISRPKTQPNPKNAMYKRKSVIVDGKKLCLKCNEWLSLERFPNSQRNLSLDGKRPWCHSCHEATVRSRKSAQGRVCPAWADKSAIEAIYQKAKMRSREEGMAYDVDHIIPIMGRFVSGLHVAWNLCIMPAKDNRSKGNKHFQE